MRPLPYRVRLINRFILAVLLFFVCFLIGKCISENEEPAQESAFYTEEKKEEPEEKITEIKPLKQEEKPQALIQEIKKENKTDSTHIFIQKNVRVALKMDNYLRAFRPDYAFYLMVDSKTNEILAWGENKEKEVQSTPDFLSRSTFPAASLIKTITVAAALESRLYSLNTKIPLIGNPHKLYKRQIVHSENYKGETISLEDAYAKSYNPPMAIVGYKVGASQLKKAAFTLGFNREFKENIPNKSTFSPPENGFALAEAASGFTEETTLSPLLAAAQIRAIITKKPLEIPYAKNLYPFAPTKPIRISNTRFSENTYYGLQEALKRSVTNGTARKNISTRYISRKNFKNLTIGCKTGTLDGTDPKGRYEWFAGYAKKKDSGESVVLIVLQIHSGATRSQPATQVAAQLINYWANQTSDKKE